MRTPYSDVQELTVFLSALTILPMLFAGAACIICWRAGWSNRRMLVVSILVFLVSPFLVLLLMHVRGLWYAATIEDYARTAIMQSESEMQYPDAELRDTMARLHKRFSADQSVLEFEDFSDGYCTLRMRTGNEIVGGLVVEDGNTSRISWGTEHLSIVGAHENRIRD